MKRDEITEQRMIWINFFFGCGILLCRLGKQNGAFAIGLA
jgi:hypothetical protein